MKAIGVIYGKTVFLDTSDDALAKRATELLRKNLEAANQNQIDIRAVLTALGARRLPSDEVIGG